MSTLPRGASLRDRRRPPCGDESMADIVGTDCVGFGHLVVAPSASSPRLSLTYFVFQNDGFGIEDNVDDFILRLKYTRTDFPILISMVATNK